MSILKPIEGHGAWEFTSPVPCPSDDIVTAPLVSIEFNETWIPAVYSALKVLTRPEAYVGSKADINRCTQDAHNLFSISGGTMPIGAIIPTMWSVIPSDWLACDGTTYLRVDYPDLYAIIDSQYIVDADHFVVPDLRGRSIVGYGIGSGLTPRVMDAFGGEETHVLTQAETPAHTHTIATAGPGGAAGPNSIPRQITSPVSTFPTSSIGSGAAHNNMHPFRVARFVVKAK